MKVVSQIESLRERLGKAIQLYKYGVTNDQHLNSLLEEVDQVLQENVRVRKLAQETDERINRWKSCERKKYFRVQDGALNEIRKGHREGFLLSGAYSYKCKYCAGWHVTNGKNDE